MEISRNKTIHTMKIGGKNYILNKTINNLERYTDLTNLYPIGEFFILCGVSKSFKQTLEAQGKHLELVIVEGVKYIELTEQFYYMVNVKKRIPYIIYKYASKEIGIKGEEIMIQCMKIGFIDQKMN